MAILSCHVSIKLPPKISDGQQNFTRQCVCRFPSRVAANPDAVHGLLDFHLRQRSGVDAHVVNQAGKCKSSRIRPSTHPDRLAGRQMRRGHLAQQETVVQMSVQIHIQRPRIGVVDSRHVIPSIADQLGRSVTGHQIPTRIDELEANGGGPLSTVVSSW